MFGLPGTDQAHMTVTFDEGADLTIRIEDASGDVLATSEPVEGGAFASYVPEGFGGGTLFAVVESPEGGACAGYSIIWNTRAPESEE